MKKHDLAKELLSVHAQLSLLEESEKLIKEHILKLMDDGEKLEDSLGSVLKVAPTSILSIAPNKARELFNEEQDFWRFIKVNVSDLKKKFGEDRIVPLGTFEERSASLRISLKK